MSKNSIEINSLNCQSCGNEYDTNDLQTIKLSGFKGNFLICASCKSKAPSELFKDASEILLDIVRISELPMVNNSERLRMIEDLLKK
jgi:NAD-dependent SIR2 family protein deacetylase